MTKKKDLLLDKVPKAAKERLLKDKTKLVEAHYKGNDKEAYSRMQFSRIYKGYDFLENFMLVRGYIQHKYNIQIQLLEQILYLAPKNFFCMEDFWEISSLHYTYKKIDTLIKLGYVAIASKGENKQKHLYTVTAKSRTICQEMHEMLSGEIPIPTTSLSNSEYKTDNLKAKIIQKLNIKEKPKTVKLLWARKIL